MIKRAVILINNGVEHSMYFKGETEADILAKAKKYKHEAIIGLFTDQQLKERYKLQKSAVAYRNSRSISKSSSRGKVVHDN